MGFAESLRQALDSLKSNKLRSFLTMLGIVMGVFSVITIVAIGNATQGYIDAEFEKVGANLISIGYKVKDVPESKQLVLDDMDTIRKVAPEIKNIMTSLQSSGSVRIGSKTRDAIVLGVSSQYKSLSPTEMAAGRFGNDMDVTARANVIVVDEPFVKRYFRNEDPLGKEVSFRSWNDTRQNLRIIGVVAASDDLLSGMMDNEDFPTIVYMPITTVQMMGSGNTERLESISVSVEGDELLKPVSDRIIKALEIKKGQSGLFSASTSADQQKIFSSVTGVISSVLLVIAVITLLVGGIGIVNILLVSVTERIREIGIRKALGARGRDILLQFITESVIMTGISGLIGILLGLVAGAVIAALVKIPPVVNVGVMVMAFLGSVLLGLIFGVYPAKKAADMDPIESLRYE
jgi:putative ABC transport system permease protein